MLLRLWKCGRLLALGGIFGAVGGNGVGAGGVDFGEAHIGEFAAGEQALGFFSDEGTHGEFSQVGAREGRGGGGPREVPRCAGEGRVPPVARPILRVATRAGSLRRAATWRTPGLGYPAFRAHSIAQR